MLEIYLDFKGFVERYKKLFLRPQKIRDLTILSSPVVSCIRKTLPLSRHLEALA